MLLSCSWTVIALGCWSKFTNTGNIYVEHMQIAESPSKFPQTAPCFRTLDANVNCSSAPPKAARPLINVHPITAAQHQPFTRPRVERALRATSGTPSDRSNPSLIITGDPLGSTCAFFFKHFLALLSAATSRRHGFIGTTTTVHPRSRLKKIKKSRKRKRKRLGELVL